MLKNSNFKTKKLPKTQLSKRDVGTKWTIIGFSIFVIVILVTLIGFILYKSVPALHETGFFNFIFGGVWAPGENGEGQYGIGTTIVSTLFMLLISLLFAVPLTIFASLFITEYLGARTKKIVVTFTQLLAGIPSVVFGLFALDQIGPMFVAMGAKSNGNLMTASVTLAFMALPTMMTLSINAIEAVPDGYRYASLALGLTKERTTFRVILRSASPKIISAVITGMARIIGETMAVIMIAGNSSGGLNTDGTFTDFIFSSVRTLAGTMGLEMLENHGSIHESALYAIGLILFFMVIIINLVVIWVSNFNVRKEKRIQRAKQLALKAARNEKRGRKKDPLDYSYKFTDPKLTSLTKNSSGKRFFKHFESSVWKFFMWTSTIIVIAFTAWVFVTIIMKGIGGFNWGAFVEIEGQRSGIFATMITTILLIFSTILFAIPLGLIVAIYLTEYSHKEDWFTKVIRFSINVFASTPSIVFGIFGLTLFVQTIGLPMSIFASSLTMTIVILPALITSFEDAINLVPPAYREAAAGMGLSKASVTFRIVLPNAMRGVLTGSILAVARIIGESAPVYLTLGTAVRMPKEGFLSSGATLTTEIYMLASEGGGGAAMGIAYMLSFVTVLLVLLLNWLSGYVSKRLDPQFKKITIVERIRRIKTTDYKAYWKRVWHGFIIWWKKLWTTINPKNIRIYYKNHKTRSKVIKDTIKEAKENGKARKQKGN